MTDPATPDRPELDWPHAFAWLPLPAEQAEPGDRYANHGTITAVYLGPDDRNGVLLPNDARIECGEGFAVTGRKGRIVILGKQIAWKVDDDA